MTMVTDQGFLQQVAMATPLRGCTLTARGQGDEGIVLIHQGLAAYRSTGWIRDRPEPLALLAEASAQAGQTTEGLVALAEALAAPTYEKPRHYSRHWREGNGQDKRHLDESVAGVQTVCSQYRRRACRLLLSMQTTEVVGMPEETAYQDFMTHCRAIWSRLVPPGEEVPLFKKR